MASKKKDKMAEDFSATVEKVIPENEKLAKSGKLNEAIENLYVLEKQTRQAEDIPSTRKLAVAIVRICFQAKKFDVLNENLVVLSKRRGQFRPVIQDFVKEAMSYLDQVNKEEKLKLLKTLRDITEGKMFVEIERAKLTKILAKIKEDEGKIAEAAEILQEVQVENFGQMEKREKVEYLLEQVRLCLDKKDYIRAQILSKKVNKNVFKEEEYQDLKLKFYQEMIRFYTHERKYLDICKSYMSIYDTPKTLQDENQWKINLQLAIVFVILAPHDNEQSDLMGRISNDKNLKYLPLYKDLLKKFMTQEIFDWSEFEKTYRSEFEKYPIFNEKVDGKNVAWQDLRTRVVQHNIRVISGYYSRITMKRLSQLLNLSTDETEKYISDLVVEKSIFAKIDRPSGIISFRKRKDPNEILNEWSNDVSHLMGLLEKTCHLINRENMIYKIE